MLLKIVIYFISIVLLIAFLVLFARWFEWSNIYFPNKYISATPKSIGLPYEDVYFRSADGVQLNGWFIPSPEDRATVLLCHGNAGNISHRMDIIRILNGLGLNVFIFDYRGYGKSHGFASEAGTYLDAEAAYDYLTETRNIDEGKIII
ncbi:MAG: alpha/beta hydrolase, partial [Candidatus Omnitrophica bacterium]|nr:alpha/beta hydrolase [Candidatus Omnitrophota bacterium]